MKTVKELEEFVEELSLGEVAYFSEEETIPAIIGFEDASRALVYDYDKLIEGFMEHFRKYDKEAKSDEDLYTEAVEWVEYNTIRSLPYGDKEFRALDKDGNTIKSFAMYKDALEAAGEEGSVEEIDNPVPIIIHSAEIYGF